MPTPQASAAVVSARGRRGGGALRADTRLKFFLKNVNDKVKLTMRHRVRLATSLVKQKVIQNISRPVTKGSGPRGGRVVSNRSLKEEYPKADTTQLLKTIFDEVVETSSGVFDGFIGTPLDYGLILETRMNRSFLVRTLTEQSQVVKRILSGPLR